MLFEADSYTDSVNEPVVDSSGNSSAAASPAPAHDEHVDPTNALAQESTEAHQTQNQAAENQNSGSDLPETANQAESSQDSSQTAETKPAEAPGEAEQSSGEAGTTADELNELMDQYAAPHQAPEEGEIV